jgi:hypothetical protein
MALFGHAMLIIDGRDESKLIDGLVKQVALVEAVMTEVALRVPVHGSRRTPTSRTSLSSLRWRTG